MRRLWVLEGVLAGMLLWSAQAATAKLCGDDVGGADVPCACGDTVVSDVVLTDDPVVHETCATDGLIVRAADSPHGITVDLHGNVLRGSGRGTGIWVIDGGPGGARIVSSGRFATIDGYRDGIAARGSDALLLLENIFVQHSRRDGIRVQGQGYTVTRARSQDSGRDGFALSGADFRITATHAVNSKRFGYFVTGMRGTIGAPRARNVSTGSGHAGFNLGGTGHRLAECAVTRAQKDGIRLNGMHFTVTRCTAALNAGNGFTGIGGDWQLADNRATYNGNNGLVITGPAMQDKGRNRGWRNFGSHREPAVIDCAINGQPCLR